MHGSVSNDSSVMQIDQTVENQVDVEVVIKPRNNFSSTALRRVVPHTDLKKKKESLSLSLINMGSSGRS